MTVSFATGVGGGPGYGAGGAAWADAAGTSLVRPDGTTAGVTTDTSTTTGLKAPLGDYSVTTWSPSSAPAAGAIRFDRFSQFNYTASYAITGGGHIGGGIDYVINSGAGTVGLMIAQEGKLENTNAGATISVAIVKEAQISANAGTISLAYGVDSTITGNAGTITQWNAYNVGDVSSITVGRKFAFLNLNTDCPINSYSAICDGSVQVPATPTNGGTSTLVRDLSMVILVPAGTIATHTLLLPTGMATGFEMKFFTTQTITALTVNGNGQTLYGNPTTMAANSWFAMQFFNGVGWIRTR